MKQPQQKSLQSISNEKYYLIVSILKGEFNIHKKNRTVEQSKIVHFFTKRKGFFSLNDESHLTYDGKKVIPVEELPGYVKKVFKTNHGCGARVLYHKLREDYVGFSEKDIIDILRNEKYYQRQYPMFLNKPVPKSVNADCPGHRWQIDIIGMRNDNVNVDGHVYRYILQIIDVYSRYTMPRALRNKTTKEVAKELEDVIFEHGSPKIIQCDNGREFLGPDMRKLTDKYNITMVHGRPYHPQSQGKCERANRTLNQKIRFSLSQKAGFNWARSLKAIAHSINTSVKSSLGNYTPFQVYFGRCHKTPKPMSSAQQRKMHAKIKKITKANGVKMGKNSSASCYRVGERVLLRYPFSKARVPTKRRVLNGTILKIHPSGNRYFIKFTQPNGNDAEKWVGVQHITSVTRRLEKLRAKVSYSLPKETKIQKKKTKT